MQRTSNKVGTLAAALAKAFANNIQARGERGIAKRPLTFARKWRLDGCREGFFRVGNLGLGLGERRGQRPDLMAESLHGRAPP